MVKLCFETKNPYFFSLFLLLSSHTNSFWFRDSNYQQKKRSMRERERERERERKKWRRTKNNCWLSVLEIIKKKKKRSRFWIYTGVERKSPGQQAVLKTSSFNFPPILPSKSLWKTQEQEKRAIPNFPRLSSLPYFHFQTQKSITKNK